MRELMLITPMIVIVPLYLLTKEVQDTNISTMVNNAHQNLSKKIWLIKIAENQQDKVNILLKRCW